MSSRTRNASKNFIWGTIGNVINSFLGFVSRTVFIYTLGSVYLGVNGLFSNVLGMLSLAELGIGTAIGFSLYKPLAQKDTKQIQAIINFYKTAYRMVAFVISVVGIALIPFLKIIVNGAESVQHLYFVYIVFLFNTVTSYFVSYKATILNADQKTYVLTNINSIVKVIATIVQTILLLIFGNYILYLLVDMAIQLVSKIYINYYTNKCYPYLKGKNDSKLSREEKGKIFTKVKALILHKVGEVSINQTDNIITSAFINVQMVGLVSNFVMLINIVNSFIVSFFNSATAGIGHVIATEKTEHRFLITKRYDFLGFLFFGWSSVVLYFLLTPFVSLWLGKDNLIDEITVALLCVNYYFTGMRIPLGNVKVAAGLYEQDRWLPIAQSIVNIIVSVVGAKYLGLKGVYLGTLISSLLPNLYRPFIVYKYVLETSSRKYYIEYIFRILILVVCVVVLKIAFSCIQISNPYLNFVLLAFISASIPMIIILILYWKSEELNYVKNMLISVYKKIGK